MKCRLAAFAALALTVPCSFATPIQMALVSGSTSLAITDNFAPDSNAATGGIAYANTNFNGWNILVTGLMNAPGLTPYGIDLSVQANCGSGSCLTQGLYVAYGGFLEFTESVTQFFATFSSQQNGAHASSQASPVFNTLDSSPLPPSLPSGDFGSMGPFDGSGVFSATSSGGGPVTSTPYTLLYFQNYEAGGTAASFNGHGTISASAVPEPSSLALLGIGMLAAGARTLSRKSRVR